MYGGLHTYLLLRSRAAMSITKVDDGTFSVPAMGAWMDARGIGEGPITDVTPIGGGTQNRVVRFRRGGEELVFRAGPTRPRPSSADAIRREARIVGALGPTSVPVPQLVAAEDDPDGRDGPFYLMRVVDGALFTERLDRFDTDPQAKHRAGLAMVDALVDLGGRDHRALGLEDFGRPNGFLERQVDRWSRQLASYAETADYTGPGIDLDPVESWLTAHIPTSGRIGIIHGDYHLNNVMLADDGEVAAIVDWELATIGDPLLDLGHLLVTWPTTDGTSIGMVPADRVDGMATPDELIERYRERSGQDLEHLTWYRVLAGYRMGVILEGTRARALAGKAPQDLGDLLHAVSLSLWQTALARVAEDRGVAP